MTEDDQSQQPSGNRWDPAATEAAEPPAPANRPSGWTRARAGFAAGAAAVLVAGGLGGFAIGRATADGAGAGQPGQQLPTGFDRDGDHGLDHGVPGGAPGGQLPGQAPGNSTDGSDT